MTGPSSSPRGKHTPRPGITWTTTVEWSGEQLVDDDAPNPAPPNRATRRAAARAARRTDKDGTTLCACTYGQRCANCRD